MLRPQNTLAKGLRVGPRETAYPRTRAAEYVHSVTRRAVWLQSRSDHRSHGGGYCCNKRLSAGGNNAKHVALAPPGATGWGGHLYPNRGNENDGLLLCC